MREQIVDLEELSHDIVEFRIKAPKDEHLQRTLAKGGEIDHQQQFSHTLSNWFCTQKCLHDNLALNT